MKSSDFSKFFEPRETEEDEEKKVYLDINQFSSHVHRSAEPPHAFRVRKERSEKIDPKSNIYSLFSITITKKACGILLRRRNASIATWR